MLKSHSRAAAAHTFRVQRQESEDEELGMFSSSIGEETTPVKTRTPAFVSSSTKEVEDNLYENPYDHDGDDGKEEIDFQKAVLYQNRIPIVSATEMNDVDFWSIDGSDQEVKGCCRRRRRLMFLMTAVALCSVGVWLCVEYVAVPSYMAPDNGNNVNDQGTNHHDKKDHIGIDIPTFPTFEPTAKSSGISTNDPSEPSSDTATIGPTDPLSLTNTSTIAPTESNTTPEYEDVKLPDETIEPTEFATVPTLLIPPNGNITFFSHEETGSPTMAPSSKASLNATMAPSEMATDLGTEVPTAFTTDTTTDSDTEDLATLVPSISPLPQTELPTTSSTFQPLPVIVGHNTTNMTVFVEENGGNTTDSNLSTSDMEGGATIPPTTTFHNGRKMELEKDGTNFVP